MNTIISRFDQMMIAITFAEAGETDWAQEEWVRDRKPGQKKQSKTQAMANNKIGLTPVTH